MATLIPDNHVYVQPSDMETQTLFAPYLRSCPFNAVMPDDLRCSIVYTTSPIAQSVLQPANVYSAFITGAQVWLDSYMNIKDMIITLDSPELQQRQLEILAQTGTRSAYASYVPHIALAYDVPNSSQRIRWWLNEVINDFNTKYKGTLIRLGSEHLASSVGNIATSDSSSKVVIKPTL